MNTLNNYVIVNRSNSRPLPEVAFLAKAEYKGYVLTVNALRNNVSKLCRLEYAGATTKETELYTNLSYEALRACYRVFSDKESGFKLKPSETDMEAIKAFACEFKGEKGSTDGKDFQAKSLPMFRKAFENFVSDRITGRVGKTAEQIDAERKAKADARRLERNAEADKKIVTIAA